MDNALVMWSLLSKDIPFPDWTAQLPTEELCVYTCCCLTLIPHHVCEIRGHHFAVQTVSSVPVGSALMVSTITNNEWAGADVTLVVIYFSLLWQNIG